MTRAAILTWTVALVFATLIGVWIVREHRIRARVCAHDSPKACVQAKKTEDGAILMGILGAVFLIMFGGVFIAARK